MNTIRIYLAESGRIADLKKDFPLYQGQFQNKLLNIYVPTSILAPDFTSQATDGTITEFVASTGVKIGITHITLNGSVKKSKNYYMRYLKTLTYQNIEYALYERKLPKEFTLYSGQGANAPTLVANVVNVQTDLTTPKVLSVITSQECKLDVMPSSLLDQDETVEPSELEVVNANLNEAFEQLARKQDKEDERLETNDKTVVGAINENKANINVNKTEIADNASQISANRDEINKIKEEYSMAEEYIGKTTGSSLPNDNFLTSFVVSTVGRQPKNGDVVIFVLTIGDDTDKNYKYIYSKNGWSGYEIPPIETARNGSLGLIEGTYNLGLNSDTLVDISGGQIVAIWVRENNGYRNIKEYLSTLNTSIQNIINGNTVVGKALMATQDALGQNIVDTYLTQNSGASKKYVRDYALPREFNDVYYISSNGYSKQVPTTPEDGIQFMTIADAVGDFELFTIEKQANAEFELSSKNSYRNNIFVASDVDCIVNFRLTTQYQKSGEDWKDLNVEISNLVGLSAGEIQKVEFSSPMTYLEDNIVSLKENDLIRQKLEVITKSSTETMFEVYSNSTYPSVFNLNTQSQILTIQQGDLGQIPFYDLEATYDSENNILTFEMPLNTIINYNTECAFVLRYKNNDVNKVDATKMTIDFGGEKIRIVTPYNKISGDARISLMAQTINSISQTDGFKWFFKGLIQKSGTNTEIIVQTDTLPRSYDLIITNQQEFNAFVENKNRYSFSKVFLIPLRYGNLEDTTYFYHGTLDLGELTNLTIESDASEKAVLSVLSSGTAIKATNLTLKNLLIRINTSQGENDIVLIDGYYSETKTKTANIYDCEISIYNGFKDRSITACRCCSLYNTELKVETLGNVYGINNDNIGDRIISNSTIEIITTSTNEAIAVNETEEINNTTINVSGKGVYENPTEFTNSIYGIKNSDKIVNCNINLNYSNRAIAIENSNNISNCKITINNTTSSVGINKSEVISNCQISSLGSNSGIGIAYVSYVSNCKSFGNGVTSQFIGEGCSNIDSETVEGAEYFGNIGKTLLLGADGVLESNRAVFTVQNYDAYVPYKTNLRSFMTDFSLPIVGTLDPSLKVAITFGDTTYNLYDIMRGTDEVLSIGDILSVSKYSTETGFRFFPEIVFFETDTIVGFTIMPTNITATQLENIIESNESVVIDTNGTKLQIHLSAEILNKLQKTLVLPTTKPTSTQLVAVDETGSQQMIELGDNLTLSNGKLSASGGGSEVVDASQTEKGIVMLASDSDITNGTNMTKAVTPAQLKSSIDLNLGNINTILDYINGEEI